MKIILKFICIIFVLFLNKQVQAALPIPHIGKLVQSDAPNFRLDLQVPPRHRWDHIIPTFKTQLRKFFVNVVDKLPISQSFYDKFGDWAEHKFIYQTYIEEIQGIAEIIEVDWRKLLLANFSYEISTLPYCTSIVARNKDNKIIHGRNMDFPFWNFFSKLTASVQFYNGDEYIATLDVQIGSVFAVTGSRPDVLTASIDTRHGPALKLVWENLLINNYKPTAFLLREVLLESKSYEEGVKRLNSTDITAPVYYIVGGINDGCVIERNPTNVHNYTYIDEEQWFIVQTNYDRSGPDPEGDNRREPAEKQMEKIGQQNIDYQNMFNKILKKFPNLNISTTYTTMMSASLKSHDLTLWYGNITDASTVSDEMYSMLEEQYLYKYYIEEFDTNQKIQMIESILDSLDLQKEKIE